MPRLSPHVTFHAHISSERLRTVHSLSSATRLAALFMFAATLSQAQLITGFTPGKIRNDFGDFVGLQFTTDHNVHGVSALGRIVLSGNSQNHTVKLVHANDGTDVPGASVTVSTASAMPGAFAYANLASTVYLQPNTSYYLVSLESNGGDAWYDYTPVQATQFLINGPVYFNGSVWTQVGAPNYSYVPVNLIADGGVPLQGTVTITSPAQGASFVNSFALPTITLSATVSVTSDFKIAGVQFKLDNLPVGPPITSGPTYTTPVEGMLLGDGGHSLVATATSTTGQSISSTPVTFFVDNSANAQIGAPGTPFITTFTPSRIRNDFTGFVGMQFTTGPVPVIVYSLNRVILQGNSGKHQVKIVRASTGQDVPGASVLYDTTAPPSYSGFVNLPAPVALLPNTSYYLVSQEQAGGDQWYDYAPVTTDMSATVNGPVYSTNGAQYVPVAIPGSSYGPANFKYILYPVSVEAVTLGIGNAGAQRVDAVISGPETPTTVQFTVDGVTFPELPVAGNCNATNAYFSDNTGPLLNLDNQLVCNFSALPRTLSLNTAHDVTAAVHTSQGSTVTATGQVSAPNPGRFFGGFYQLINFTPTTLRNNYSGLVGFQFTVTAPTEASSAVSALRGIVKFISWKSWTPAQDWTYRVDRSGHT